MAHRLRLRFETYEGQPCSRPPVSTAELREVFATDGLLELLQQAGLPARDPKAPLRIDLRDLTELANRLDRAAPGVKRLQELLRETSPSGSRPVFLVLGLQTEAPALSLLQHPTLRSEDEYEHDLAGGDAERIDEALATLATWSQEQVTDPTRLGTLLLPHLRATRTRGAAAQVVGALQLTRQAPLLERLLRQGNTLPNRLAILGALLDLDHDEIALRTLRSMLIYGPKSNHHRIVDLLVSHTHARHLGSLRAMVRLLDPIERVVVSALLYGLGEMSAYSMVSRAVNALNKTTAPAITTRVLAAVPLADSTRFIPLLRSYAEREERSWFSARAVALAGRLESQGRRETSCSDLLNEIEHAMWTGETEIGMRLVEQLTVLEPNHARALYLKASMLKDEDRLEEALKCATTAIAADPSDWQLHRLRGSLQWDLGRSDAALEAYDRALELNPTDPFTWYYKGYVLYRLRKPTHALPCLNRSLSLQADEPAVLNHKAFCLEQLERYEEAAFCYRRSLRNRPADLPTRDHLAAALHKSGAFKEALVVVDVTLKMVPHRIRSLEQRAETLRSMKQWKQAEAAFTDLVREAPDQFNGWVSRGTINHRLGNLEKAVECLRQAVRLRPESVPARNLLTRFLRQMTE